LVDGDLTKSEIIEQKKVLVVLNWLSLMKEKAIYEPTNN
jgi:hypothetical protein